MGIITGIVSGAIGWTAYVINYILGFIAGILFQICGVLVNCALDLNSNVIETVISGGVKKIILNSNFEIEQ